MLLFIISGRDKLVTCNYCDDGDGYYATWLLLKQGSNSSCRFSLKYSKGDYSNNLYIHVQCSTRRQQKNSKIICSIGMLHGNHYDHLHPLPEIINRSCTSYLPYFILARFFMSNEHISTVGASNMSAWDDCFEWWMKNWYLLGLMLRWDRCLE